ncbi:hypothetical protein INT44_002606 [Umbelopsis vinacea]|uniref:Uncharacterized protein n=1 Tax=Umbelopsis vinacea TaxID=44442 RepID=A0A8H7PFX9_9FUNG|nr:hypothetical protein INT44_002606 [Umbelopsis vinacea]
MKIDGSVAIITGGASGMGKALAEKLASQGGKVLIADRDTTKGPAVAADLNERFGAGTAIFHETDLTKWKTLEAGFEKAKTEFGKINIVVNNAGIVETSTWMNDNDPREDVCDYLVLNVDLTAVAKGSRLAIQYFANNREGGEGVVISTSSLYGLFNSGIVPLYAAAKAGVVSLVKSHAMQKEFTNTRHVAICPWFVDTPLLEDHFRGALAHNNVELIQPERVVEAFIMAIENDDLNGAILKVFPEETTVQEELLSTEDLALANHVRAMEQFILKRQTEAHANATKP